MTRDLNDTFTDLRAEIDGLRAERDRARDMAAALEGENARLREWSDQTDRELTDERNASYTAGVHAKDVAHERDRLAGVVERVRDYLDAEDRAIPEVASYATGLESALDGGAP